MVSNLRIRGVEVHVDTAQTAEYDIKSYPVPEKDVEVIALNLKTVTVSENDRFAGPVRVREVNGWDVAYLLARENRMLIITIAHIRRPDLTEPLEEKLKRLGVIATLRGAAGL